jgi:hypothetical protein
VNATALRECLHNRLLHASIKNIALKVNVTAWSVCVIDG